MILGFFQAQEKNRQAEKAADRQNEYNEDMWNFSNEEADRAYKFKKEGLEITKRNNERNTQFQEALSIQQYDSAMAMRNYQETEKFNAWSTSISQAAEQVDFNAMATKTASTQQDRALSEQLTGLMFDKQQTLQDFGMATMGLSVKRKSERAQGAANVQQERIAALKAKGTQQARGSLGRSSTKAVIGLMAESGARQANIVQQMLFNEQGMDLDVTKLREQLYLDRAMIKATEENIIFNDKAVRTKFLQDQVQADMNAMANIMTKPTALPPIPKPLVLPRAEYQDILKPRRPPKPGEVVAQTTNPWLALAGDVVNVASAVATGGATSAANGGFWAGFLGSL